VLNADFRGLVIVDVDVSEPVNWNTAETLPLPADYPVSTFSPTAWSPNGRWIAGVEDDGAGRTESFAIYDLENKSLRRLDLGAEGLQQLDTIAGWLSDSRSLVLQTAAGMAIHDTVAGTTRLILGGHPAAYVDLVRNGEVLMVEHEVLDSEIWLLDF